MWGGTDERDSIRTIHAALDRGINLIDTAPVYGFGRSEEIVGKALKQYGDKGRVHISTKAGLEWKGKAVYRNSSRERILKEIDDSLKRLGREYIDIYHVHWPDPLVPIEETAEAMGKVHQDGKILAVAVSNYTPEQMSVFRQAVPLHFAQPPYNLFERGIEHDVMPYCKKHGISLLTYGALCRGLLSGKMKPDTEFHGDDLRKIDPKFQPPHYENYLKAVDKLGQFSRQNYGKNVIHLAVRWILDQGTQIAIWGARRPEQLDELAGTMGWSLDEQAKKEIASILKETIKQPIEPEFMAPPSR